MKLSVERFNDYGYYKQFIESLDRSQLVAVTDSKFGMIVIYLRRQ